MKDEGIFTKRIDVRKKEEKLALTALLHQVIDGFFVV